jgi:hypothetical protein
MPTAEVRYVRMIGDYILDIMPESARRRQMVLAYITDRILGRPRARQFAIAAAIAIASSAVTIAADSVLDAQAAGPSVRIVQNESGNLSMVLVREESGRIVVLHREPLTVLEAKTLTEDPQWAAKALSRLAKGA